MSETPLWPLSIIIGFPMIPWLIAGGIWLVRSYRDLLDSFDLAFRGVSTNE